MAENQSTPVSNATHYWEGTLEYYVGIHGMFILAPIGVLSNVFAFIVFGRMKPTSGFTIYLQGLAFADLMSLTWDTIFSTALPRMGIKIESRSYWWCKIGIWHDMSGSTVASCALLLVSVDRFVYFKFPGIHKTRCKGKKFAAVICVLLWVFTYTYCSPLIYFYEYSEINGCSLSSEIYKQQAGLQFVTFVTYGPYFSIPVVGILISNAVIVRMLVERKQNRIRLGKSDHNDSDEICWLLILDGAAFLILIAVTAALWALAWNPPVDDHQAAQFGLMFVLAQFTGCIQESVDFFLYFVYSKKFRSTFFKLFGIKNQNIVETISLQLDSTRVASNLTQRRQSEI